MGTGVLFLMLVLLLLLLVAFVYQIVTTPLTAVDAPSLVRSAAAQSAPAPALPVRQRRAAALPAATGLAAGSAARGASHRVQSSITAALAIGGLAAIALGGSLFLRIAHGAAVCSHQAIEVCSQGFVLLTSTQLAGGAIALAGLTALVTAVILALR